MHQIPLRLLTLFCLLFLLIGCSVPSKFAVFNNTGAELTISFRNNSELKYVVIAINTSTIIENWDGNSRVTITSSEKSWSYKPLYINHVFGEGTYFSHWLFKLQVEPNGQVFVLKPELEFPQIKHVKQPEGYPLSPQNKNV